MRSAGYPVFRLWGQFGNLALVTATFLGLAFGTVSAAEWEIAALFLAVLVVLIRQFPQKHNEQPVPTIACTLLGLLYVSFLFNFFTKLALAFDAPSSMMAPVGATGRLLVFLLVVVVKTTDAGAYFVGRYLGPVLGPHLLFPRISPKKTWEGLIGGLLAGVLGGCLFFLAAGVPAGEGVRALGRIQMSWGELVLLSLVLAGAGAVGDLVESLIKRAAGAKDSGHMIPGMGGILDIFDSLLVTAPILYFAVRVFLL